jgi:hypothetical protein
MNFVSIYFLHFVATLEPLVVVTRKLHGLLEARFLLCFFHCDFLFVLFLFGFSSSLAEDVAHGLVLFPLFELAFARAVPNILTPGASLSSERSTDLALRIFHKVLIDIVGVELEHAVHVFFGLLGVLSEESNGLHGSNLFKVFALQDSGP